MKAFLEKYYNFLFIIFLIIISSLAFSFGYQYRGTIEPNKDIVFSCSESVLEAQKISVSEDSKSVSSVSTASVISSISENTFSPKEGAYVGSKNGTKYYTPGCAGSKRIKPENYVWFQNAQDATLQGYTKGSC